MNTDRMIEHERDIEARNIEAIVIGTSAGGIQALLTLLAPLPSKLRLPIVIVIHLLEKRDCLLMEVFQHHLAARVRLAQDKEAIEPDTVYFAGPGYHLSIERHKTFSLSNEEPMHYSRPAIDMLMTSAADAYGPALLGIILTGCSEDGALGLASIQDAGGLTVVEDPVKAEFPIMPRAAIALRKPNFVLPLNDIHKLIHHLETQ
jgi:two-component system chemotaxis response regulator CheB